MAEERVQRRLAAILATDVVDYSRLMGADEAGTLEGAPTGDYALKHALVQDAVYDTLLTFTLP